jgi:proline iminopeptidase
VDELTVSASDGVPLHVRWTGEGMDVVVLSGGPGYVHYLAREDLAPAGARSSFPDPRGVGRSGGGPHDMARAVADLEDIRQALGLDRWVVLGHSWGADLAVRYALGHAGRVAAVVAVAGHLGSHRTAARTFAPAQGTIGRETTSKGQ